MGTDKPKKSFKKFATKHLAGKIETRRMGAKGRKEKAERISRRNRKEHDDAAKEERDHKDELDALKDVDPDFHAYLEEEDPTLLQFGDEEMDIVDDEDGSDAETDEDEEEGEETEESAEKKEAAVKKGRVNREEMQAAVKAKDVVSLVDLFLSASREMGAKVSDRAQGGNSHRKFNDPALVKDTLVEAANAIGAALPSLIKTEKGATTPSFKSPKVRTLVKRFLLCCVAVIADVGSDVVLAALLFKALSKFINILHLIRGCTKALLKVALHTCSSGEEDLRINAYMVVRKLATRAAGSRSMYQSSAFKGIFLSLVRCANTYNVHNLKTIGFLMNCVLDLYGTDPEAAYQHSFVYLRQLAIYLRAALQQQSQANVRTVFNWQFVNALRTWGLVVSSYSEPDKLGPLIHPVVQLSLGVMDLFSSPRCYPMHLHILEMLNQLSTRSTGGVYIPISTYILRILCSPSLALDKAIAAGGARNGKKQRGASSDDGDAGDLQFAMRCKKAHQKTQAYVVAVWTESLYLLVQHLATHSHSIGFPEAFWTVTSTLNKLRKEIRYPKIHSQMSALLSNIDQVSKAIKTKRDNVNFGPCDAPSVKIFEDELRVANINTPGKALVKFHLALQKNRSTEAEARRNSQKERQTLDSFVDSKQREVGSKSSRRQAEGDDEEFDAGEYVEGEADEAPVKRVNSNKRVQFIGSGSGSGRYD